MSTEANFKSALAFIKSGATVPGAKPLSTSDQLQFYGLFKQATEGPCKGKTPSRLQVTKRAKFMAWKSVGSDVSKEQAMERYVKLLDEKTPGWRGKPKL